MASRPAGSAFPYSPCKVCPPRRVLSLEDAISEDFDQAVRAYSAELYRFAYWLSGDRHAAEDLVQEACLRAWKSWPQLRDPAQAKAWLMTIVRNEHARSHSRKRNETNLDELDESELPPAPSFEPGLDTAQALRRLPQSYREPLLLQVLGGFSCAEIALMLGTSEGAIMTRLTRARQALRQHHERSTRSGTG